MTLSHEQDQCEPGPAVLGLDVAKASVTIYDLASGRCRTVPNRRQELLRALESHVDCALAVCEATGGWEDVLLEVLATLGIPAHRADALKVRAFMRSHGTLAKTDPIDARGLARYGRDRFDTLPRWTPAANLQGELAALVERRRDLVAMRASERNRLKAPRAAAIADDLSSLIDDLTRRIRAFEQRIAKLIAQSRQLDAAAKALQDIPGIGPTIAAVLLAGLPELGAMTRQQAAALAGLAPHPRDSGSVHRHRSTTGGRRTLRQPLFLAALTATRSPGKLADAYNDLLKRGKPKRLALIAIARRIVVIANAKVRDANLLLELNTN